MNKIKILLIEDSPEDIVFVTYQLKKSLGEAHDLKVTDYFSKAAKLIEENNFDLIILDLCLPDSNGLVSFKALRSTCTLPIIIYSGMSDGSVKEHAIKLGASDYLVKGETDIPQLLKSIQNVIS